MIAEQFQLESDAICSSSRRQLRNDVIAQFGRIYFFFKSYDPRNLFACLLTLNEVNVSSLDVCWICLLISVLTTFEMFGRDVFPHQ